MKPIIKFKTLITCLYFLGLFNLTVSAQYIGSQHFFNIQGEWVKVDSVTNRYNKVIFEETIYKTYRVKAYAKIGKKELPLKWAEVKVSEEDFSFVATLAGSKCLIMPVFDQGVEKLYLHTLIVDPNGNYTGKALDVMVRKSSLEQLGPNPPNPEISFEQFAGHWKNEWDNYVRIPKLQIYNNEGKYLVKFYRIVNDRVKLLGELEPTKSKTDDNYQVVYTDPIINQKTIGTFFPIFVGDKIKGIDLQVDEVYSDGVPKNTYRQFFVADPNAERNELTEKLIKNLEGEWVAILPGPTAKLIVQQGDIEIFLNSSLKTVDDHVVINSDLVSLDKKPLTALDGDMGEWLVGTAIKSFSSNRTCIIETDLDLNTNREKPVVLVLNTKSEGKENKQINIQMSEVFVRKDFDLKTLQKK